MAFQILDQDDKSFKLQQPDGSELVIAKSGLTPELQAQITGTGSSSASTPAPMPSEPALPGPMDLSQAQSQGPVSNPILDGIRSGPKMASLEPMVPTAPAAESSGIPASAEQNNGSVDPSALAVGATTPAQPASDASKGYMSGFAKQQQGILDSAKAGQDRAVQEAAYLEQMGKEAEKRNIEAEKRRADQDAQIKTQLSQVEALSKDIAANSKIDPNRYWANQSTGQKITAAAGIFMGAIGGALTGQGGNAALDVINKAIERDMEAQKANLQSKQQALGNQMNMVSTMRATFSDQRQADAAAMSAMYDQAKLKVQQLAVQQGGAEAQAKAKIMMGQLDQEKAKYTMAFEQAARLNQARAGLASGQQVDPNVLPKEDRERYVQGAGLVGLAHTKEGAEKIREAVGSVESSKHSINRLLEIGKSDGRQFVPTQVAQEAKTLRTMLKASLRTQVLGPGAVTESEWKLLDDLIADPTKVFKLDDNSQKRLEVLRDTMVIGLQEQAKAQGIRPTVNFKPAR